MKKVINVLFVTLLALGTVSAGRAMEGGFEEIKGETLESLGLTKGSPQVTPAGRFAVTFKGSRFSVYKQDGFDRRYHEINIQSMNSPILGAAINGDGKIAIATEHGTHEYFGTSLSGHSFSRGDIPKGLKNLHFNASGDIEYDVDQTLFESPWFRYGLPVALVVLVAGGVAYYVANKNKEKADTPESQKAVGAR